MANYKHKITIYLPLLFSLVLIAGILIGVRLLPKAEQRSKIFSVDFSKYSKVSDVLGYIMRDWVDTVNLQSLEDDAIVNILNNLDPHSQYIPAAQFDEVAAHLEGNFEGIGVQFRIEKDTVLVVSPIAGGPSEKVGIRAGDRIVVVDGDTIAGIGVSNQDVMRRLKGPKNTKVNVGIFRRGEISLLDFSITRGVIPTYSLDIAYMVDDDIGYVKLNKFSATTHNEFNTALKELKNEGMSKMILDLRNNSGGYLQAAISVSDEFLADRKLIVYTEGRSRPRSYAYATRRGNLLQEEIVVLIDEGSASASEIVAGAIQDNDRGTIIGRRSFGKGLVQEQINLFDGSALRLTTAKYFTPTGRSIQKPWVNGDDNYFKEYHQRFVNGEVFHADSIHFDDSLKFVTPGGKVVYGGGGIMPDIFIPIETGEHLAYYNRLVNRGVIFDFAFEYTDANRESLNKFTDYKKFGNEFIITQTMFDELVAFAQANGIEPDQDGIEAMREDIEILLKALIGRNILDNEGFYPVYHLRDNIFNQAVKILRGESV
jgi:carboxyl-terminal processing protease